MGEEGEQKREGEVLVIMLHVDTVVVDVEEVLDCSFQHAGLGRRDEVKRRGGEGQSCWCISQSDDIDEEGEGGRGRGDVVILRVMSQHNNTEYVQLLIIIS